MIQLRDYQNSLRIAISKAMREGCKRTLAVMATGGGKTAVATYMTHVSLERDFGPVWFLVHRRELMEQTSAAFARAGINVGHIAVGELLEPHRHAHVCLIGSMPRRIGRMPKPKVVIVDEAHHAVSATYTKIIEELGDIWLIGLTATPERLDGKGLGQHFDRIVEGPSMRWLIDNGYLADYRIFCPPSIDTTGVHKMAGDFNKKELEDVLKRSTIMGDAIREYKLRALGKRTILRALSRDDSGQMAEQFKAAGFSAAHLDARNTAIERKQIFGDFQRGELKILCNVELFGEGVDIPGIECAIDLRPTQSLTMFLQFCGRALRPAPGKDKAIIIDHVGNVARHGLPDEDREWSLDGRTKKKKPAQIWTCKVCWASFNERYSVCPECGAVDQRVMTGRAGPDKVEGQLEELDLERAREAARQKPRRSYDQARRQARTLEQLEVYEKEKGYRPGWARHVWESRQKRGGAAA